MTAATNHSPENDVAGQLSILNISEIKSIDQFLSHTKKQWIRIKDLNALPASERGRHVILVEVEEIYDVKVVRKTRMWMTFRVKEVAPTASFAKAISDLPAYLTVQNKAGLVAQDRIEKGDILAIVSPLICNSCKPNTSFDLSTHNLASIFVGKQGGRASVSAIAGVPVFQPPWPELTEMTGHAVTYSTLRDCAQMSEKQRGKFYAVVTEILIEPTKTIKKVSWHAMYAIVDETCCPPLMEGTPEYTQWITSHRPKPKDYVFHIFGKEDEERFPSIKEGDVIRVHGVKTEEKRNSSTETVKEIPHSKKDFRTFCVSSVVVIRRNEPPVSTGKDYSFTVEERDLAIRMLNFADTFMPEYYKAYRARTFAELSGLTAESDSFVNLAGRLVHCKNVFSDGKISFWFYIEDGTFCDLPLEKPTKDIDDKIHEKQDTPAKFPVVKIRVPVDKKGLHGNIGSYLLFRGVLMKKTQKGDEEFYSFDLQGGVYQILNDSKFGIQICERIANSKQMAKAESQEVLLESICEPSEGVLALEFPSVHFVASEAQKAQEVPLTSTAMGIEGSQQPREKQTRAQTLRGPVCPENTTQYRVPEHSSVPQPVNTNGDSQDEEMDIDEIFTAITYCESNQEMSSGIKVKLDRPIITPSPIMNQNLDNGNLSPRITGERNLELSLSMHSGEESDSELFEPSPTLLSGLRADPVVAQKVATCAVRSSNSSSSIYGTPRELASQRASLRCAPGPSSEIRAMQIERDEALTATRKPTKLNEAEIDVGECDSESEEELVPRQNQTNSAYRKRVHSIEEMKATGSKRPVKGSGLNSQRDKNDTATAADVLACEKWRRNQMEGNVSKVFLKGLIRELDSDPVYSFEDLKQGGRKAKIIGVELDQRLGELTVEEVMSEWVFGVCSSCSYAYSYTLFRHFTSDSCQRRDFLPLYPRNVLSQMILNNFHDGSTNAEEDEAQRVVRYTCRVYHCPECIAGNVDFTECYLVPTFLTTLQLNDEQGQDLNLFLGGLSAEYFFGVSVSAFLHKAGAQERFMANLRKLAGQKLEVRVERMDGSEGQQEWQIFGTKNEF